MIEIPSLLDGLGLMIGAVQIPKLPTFRSLMGHIQAQRGLRLSFRKPKLGEMEPNHHHKGYIHVK